MFWWFLSNKNIIALLVKGLKSYAQKEKKKKKKQAISSILEASVVFRKVSYGIKKIK